MSGNYFDGHRPAGVPKTRDDDRRGAKPGQSGVAPYEPDEASRKLVREYVVRAGQKAMARKLGISTRTLAKHYAIEIAEAEFEAGKDLGNKAMSMALAGDAKMIRWMLESRFGWGKEEKAEDEKPQSLSLDVQVDVKAFFAGLKDDELSVAIRLLERLTTATGSGAAPGDVQLLGPSGSGAGEPGS